MIQRDQVAGRKPQTDSEINRRKTKSSSETYRLSQSRGEGDRRPLHDKQKTNPKKRKKASTELQKSGTAVRRGAQNDLTQRSWKKGTILWKAGGSLSSNRRMGESPGTGTSWYQK